MSECTALIPASVDDAGKD